MTHCRAFCSCLKHTFYSATIKVYQKVLRQPYLLQPSQKVEPSPIIVEICVAQTSTVTHSPKNLKLGTFFTASPPMDTGLRGESVSLLVLFFMWVSGSLHALPCTLLPFRGQSWYFFTVGQSCCSDCSGACPLRLVDEIEYWV